MSIAMTALGNDEYGKFENKRKNWPGVKDFGLGKVEKMKALSDRSKAITNMKKQAAACAEKVVGNMAVERDDLL